MSLLTPLELSRRQLQPPRAALPPLMREVRSLFLRSNFTAEQFCKRIGIASSTLSTWWHRHSNPKLATIVDALDALGYELKIVRKEKFDDKDHL